jgi:hypothetical protein
MTIAMVSAAAQAVGIREMVHNSLQDLIGNLAQTSVEAEGCGDSNAGTQAQYFGP